MSIEPKFPLAETFWPGRIARRVSFLLALVALIPATAPADDEPPQVQARQLTLADGWVHDVILPGRPLDVAPFPGGGVAVLIARENGDEPDSPEPNDDERPRDLYRILGQASDIQPVATDLPVELDALAGRNGRLWAAEPGSISMLTSDFELRPILGVEGLDLGILKSRALVADNISRIAVPEVGRLTFYEPSPDGLDAVGGIDLPVRARRLSRGFELWSPVVRPLKNGGQTVDGLWGTHTEALGSLRVRALLIRADRPEGEQIEENWFRFKTPENVEQHHWATIDGRPALIVATTPGDKLGIFQKLNLRVFYTGADRTRSGRGPSTSIETVSRRWYAVDPSIHELTGDGKDDLVVVQPEGMGGGDLVIDLYPGKGNGRFEERRPRRTKLKDQGGRWHFGTDFNNDQRPDLAVVAAGRLEIYSVDPSHKRKVLMGRPFFALDGGTENLASTQKTVEISAGSGGSEVQSISARGHIHSFDTDGDGRPEAVLRREVEGRAVIRVISPR